MEALQKEEHSSPLLTNHLAQIGSFDTDIYCSALVQSYGKCSKLIMNTRVRHRGAVPPGLKKSNLAEFSQGETEKSDLNPEFRGAGVEAG